MPAVVSLDVYRRLAAALGDGQLDRSELVDDLFGLVLSIGQCSPLSLEPDYSHSLWYQSVGTCHVGRGKSLRNKSSMAKRSGPRTARDDISARIKASPLIYIIANIPSLTFDVADFEEAK